METNFSSNRYEIKFIVPVKEFENIKRRLSDMLESDIYHDDVNDGYYNHSIYFDTPELEHYYLKREGMNRRVKLRLRAHKPDPYGTPSRIILEFKHRLGHIGTKDKHILTEAEAFDVLGSRVLPGLRDSSGPVPSAYYLLVKQSTLRPVVTILYHRAAYHAAIYPGVRITFDKDIRASSLTSLSVPPSSFHSALDPRMGVIELKYFHSLPRLIMHRFNELGLQQATFSKYAAGLETTFLHITETRQALCL
jgi:hypothetical protein